MTWIDCNDQMPDFDQPVVVIMGYQGFSNGRTVARLKDEKACEWFPQVHWFTGGERHTIDSVLAWSPLEDVPKLYLWGKKK
jgi:hypothetical protein